MQNKKGISLIVLIITVIVMIILAGAIVLSLNNSGIIDKANEAVDKTNEAELKQIAQLGWAEAYAEYGADLARLKSGVNEAIANSKIDTSEYGIAVTTKGVTVVRGWAQEGLTVNKGGKVIDIGDTIEYEATGTDYEGEWKILGASDSGELLIMSTENTNGNYFCDNLYDYPTYISGLNTDSLVYGKGKGATNARSITVEDINKITGYNPEMADYGKGEIYEYGNEVTFWWTGDEEVSYTSQKNSSMIQLNAIYDNGGVFYYPKDTEVITSTVSENATKDNPQKIATLKMNAYEYYVTTLTTSSIGEIKGLATDSKAYKMLFGDEVDSNYMLASLYIGMTHDSEKLYYPEYGFFNLGSGKIITMRLGDAWDWTGSPAPCNYRTVVSLSPDINLTGNSTNGWSY